MEDPELRRKYMKCKYVAKMWEKDFQRKHGTIPSKYDIQDAPRKIRDAYKKYYQLKKAMKEDTASEIFSEDGFDSNLDISQDISNMSNISQSLSQIPELTQPENVWGDEVSYKKNPALQTKEKFETQKTSFRSLNTKFFSGYSFAKRNPRKSLSRTTSLPGKSISSLSLGSDAGIDTLPDLETILIAKAEQQTKHETLMAPAPVRESAVKNKLDKGWLSRHFSESSLSGFEMETQSSMNSDKFGLSNINVEIFRQWSSPNLPISDFSPIIENRPDNILPILGTEMTLQCSENDRSVSPIIPKLSGNEQIPLNKPVIVNETQNDSDSVVENSEDESPKRRFESIRPTVKKRKIEIENDETNVVSTKEEVTKIGTFEDEQSTDESKKNTRTQKGKKRKNLKAKRAEEKNDTEDESFEVKPKSKPKSGKKSAVRKVDKVDNKSKTKMKRQLSKRRNPVRTSKSICETIEEESVDVAPECITFALDSKKLTSLPRVNIQELEEAEEVINKYIHDVKDVGESKIVEQKVDKPQLREISGWDNLEAKVNSGRVNENFVRINLKKKTFVRGKKSVNFSKYKKNLWKQKKAAALCGPDMDMRGCDGGVLKCFKCGLAGHFAQKCPMKGDALLPLDSAQADESPFPTLAEAEDMAKGKALLVHSKNLENLPPNPNKMLYQDNEDLSEKENDDSMDCAGVLGEEMVEKSEELIPRNVVKPIGKSNTYIGHKVPQDFLEKAGLIGNENLSSEVGPLYELNNNGEVIEPTQEVMEALRMFGHSTFRKGQEKAIMRILSGVSTLVTLSTGSGKSLCYQLPAYLYSKKKRSITLVVSPLVSLMEDQVHGVPAFLNAHCLHTNQNPTQRRHVLEMINKGCVDVLLVSPEAIVAGERSTGFGSILRSLPPIAFACIDEVHCVSQWSHNFRPSYLMICKVLKTKLGVNTILGLTATATFQTRESIIKHLNIPDGINGIICDIPLPDNLYLSVSRDEQRDFALVELLRSPRFSECQSIIVYCTRRDECERVATFIRTCLQDQMPSGVNTGKRRRTNWCAEPYHAGMAASRRRTVQKAFMQNELRIVVATVAFGMGINKPDIRAVIHYNMPKTFESYVQEVGRAGRDGLPAHCHLFLDSKGSDQNELRRHIFANSIDRHVIRKLLQKVFVPCSCSKNIKQKEFVDEYAKEIEAVQMIDWDDDYFCETKKIKKRVCPGHEIGIPVSSTVELLDIPEENISTLLCYLELDGRWSLKTLSNAYMMCKIISYSGPVPIKKAAKECPPLAMAIALEIKKGKFDEMSNIFEFSVIEIAAAIGWNSGVVKYQLKNLEWTTVNGLPKRSPLSVSFHELGFRIQSPGDFTDDELDEALDVLYNRSVNQEKTQLAQLQQVFDGLSSVACNTYLQCSKEDWSSDSMQSLKSTIREYFKKDMLTFEESKLTTIDTSHDDMIIRDVQSMINMYPENTFTGRSLARIFHGIQSPNFSALMWSRCKYWRAHSKIDFNHIVRLANAVIIEMRR